jgi:hypothetical protein
MNVNATKISSSLLLIFLVAYSLPLIPSVSASKPSAPEFTVAYVDSSYYVPPTYGIDQYTGENVTVKESYMVNGKNIVFTIVNQPFASYADSSGNNIGLYYNFRFKGYYGTQWGYYPFGSDGRTVMPYNGQPWGSGDLSPKYPASNADKTVISISLQILDIRDAKAGSQIDVQVQAMEGYVDIEVTGLLAGNYFNFVGETSDWSSAQTVSLSDGASETTTAPVSPSSAATVMPENPTATPMAPDTQTGVLETTDWWMLSTVALVVVVAVLVAVVIVVLQNKKASKRWENGYA